MEKKTDDIINKDIIRNRLYEKYIEPTTKGKKDFIGIEIEIPIVNLNRDYVDFNIVHKVTREFLDNFHLFEVLDKDHENNIISVVNKKTNDIISYDCSYNNIEFAMGKEKNLFEINKRFLTYYKFFKKCFEKYNYTLTGMGINPYRKYNHNVPIPSERYLMLFHYLNSYKKYNVPMYFHNYPEYGTFASASQVQLDVTYDNLVDTINIFSKLEPLKAVLFSNSILLGENEELLCCRDMLWENSSHGINPHNIGMYDIKFDDIDDFEDYIESLSMYSVKRNGKYISFPPRNIFDYFNQDYITGEYYCKGGFKSITFKPDINDIEYLRSFKFVDLTFRGTIEYRSVCTQPIKDTMTVAAFHLGLKYKLKELKEILENDHVIYHHGYNSLELRKLLVKDKLPEFINEDKLYDLIRKVVDLAKEGLKERGYGEEKFINPLYNRINERTNPAKQILSLTNQGINIDKIIKEYGDF